MGIMQDDDNVAWLGTRHRWGRGTYRTDDVAYFNPVDQEFPIGFDLLLTCRTT